MKAKVNSQCQTKSVDFKKSQNNRKYSVGLGAGGGRTFLNSLFPSSGYHEENNKTSHTKIISELNKIDEGMIFRQSRDTLKDYPLEDVKNIHLGLGKQQSNFNGSAERTTGANQSPMSQSSNQYNQYWQTNYPGGSNAQINQQNWLNERKRAEISSSNSGLLTTQKFFHRQSFNSQINKSQSLSHFQGQNKSQNISRYDNNPFNQRIEPSRSINDFLHRNNVALNIHQQMSQMDQITQEVIKQNSISQQQQKDQLQKLQSTQHRQEDEEQNLQLNTNKVNTRQYYIQVQKQLQKAQNNFINGIQQRDLPSDNEQKKKSDQLNNFVSLDKIQQQQSIKRDNQKQAEQDINSPTQINKSSYASPNFDLTQQQVQPKPKQKSQHTISKYQEKQQKTSENIFSLTGQKNNSIQVRNKLPHQDVLSLCNQSFIDNLNALRKAINKQQKDNSSQKSVQQLQSVNHTEQQDQSRRIDGLEGHSITKSSHKFLLNKGFLENKRKSKIHLKSEVNDTQSPEKRDIEKTKYSNSERVAPVLRSRVRGENWKGSTHFKVSNNYQKSFTLKQLKGAFDKNNNFNPDGSSTQWKYYLQDTIKQYGDPNQHTKSYKLAKSKSGGTQFYENSKQNDNEEMDDIYLNPIESPLFLQQENQDQRNEEDDKNSSSSSSYEKSSPTSEQNSFYKILKKQNMHMLDNNRGNISQYEIIDEQFDKIFETRFHKNLAIRKVDMVYNIKHLAILKYKREKKLLEGSQDPKDLLDYIQKKNKIQILLHNAKKISNLQQVALVIENKINQQNSRINSIVDQLLIKFDINQQQ